MIALPLYLPTSTDRCGKWFPTSDQTGPMSTALVILKVSFAFTLKFFIIVL